MHLPHAHHACEDGMKSVSLRRTWVAIVFFFFCLGMVYGLLTARIPALSQQIGADEAVIGMAMLSLGCGSLGGFAAMHLLQRRYSTRSVLRAGSLALLAFLPLCALAGNALLFCAGCGALGFAFALSDVSVNTQGLLLEHRFRRSCLSGLHAGYSLGGLSGSALGAVFAGLGLSPLVTFGSMAVLLLLVWLWAGRHLLPDPAFSHTPAATAPARQGVPGVIIICGFLAMAAFAVEGACAEWSGLLLHTVKGADESTAALGFGAFSVAIAVGRLFGDALRRKVGDLRLILGSSLLAALGSALVLASPWPLLCLAGYALTGLGAAPIMPTMLSRAGARADITPQRATTVIATLGYAGLLVIPPSIGWLARWAGLETALLLPLCLALVLAASSVLFRQKGGI